MAPRLGSRDRPIQQMICMAVGKNIHHSMNKPIIACFSGSCTHNTGTQILIACLITSVGKSPNQFIR